MSDNSAQKENHWKIHLFWLCILAFYYIVDSRDHHVTLKELGSIIKQAEETDVLMKQLMDEISRFDDENWRDVVPSVRQKAESVKQESLLIVSFLHDLESRLTPSDGDPGDYDQD